MKLKLQLFAYDPYSIVDYLKSKGEDSSFSARKKLAVEYGIVESEGDYKGSGTQNTSLMKALKEGKPKETEKPATTEVKPAQSNNASGVVAQPTNTQQTTPANTTTVPVVQTYTPAPAPEIKTYTPTPAPEVKPYTPTPAPELKPVENQSVIAGVNQELYDKAYNSTFTPSQAYQSAATQTTKDGDKVREHASKTDIVDANTMEMLNTPFQVSQAYLDAMTYTNSFLAKLQSGRTSYTDQLEAIMSKIQNREEFSYDADTDQLFQQALASSINKGQAAMQNTIGQASALTGGYGSTYATSAGNQAYNAFIEDAYNNLPEYYQMALNAYQIEGDEMYQQYAMLSEADAKEYQRTYDAWNASYTNAQDMYNRQFGEWQANVNNAYNSANLQINQHNAIGQGLLNAYNISKDERDTIYNQEYQAYADMVSNAQQAATAMREDYWSNADYNYRTWADSENMNMNNYWNQQNLTFDNYWKGETLASENHWNEQTLAQDAWKATESMNMENYWNQTNYNEDVRQFDASMAQDKTQFDATMAENKRQFDASLAQDQSQFDATMAYNKSKGSSGSGGSDTKTKSPTETQMNKALTAYNEGGETEYFKYIDSLPSNIDIEAVDSYVMQYGELPLESRTYTKIEDTTNWFWGNDNNDKVVDQYGNEYEIGDLPKSIRGALTDLKEGQSYTKK